MEGFGGEAKEAEVKEDAVSEEEDEEEDEDEEEEDENTVEESQSQNQTQSQSQSQSQSIAHDEEEEEGPARLRRVPSAVSSFLLGGSSSALGMPSEAPRTKERRRDKNAPARPRARARDMSPFVAEYEARFGRDAKRRRAQERASVPSADAPAHQRDMLLRSLFVSEQLLASVVDAEKR